MSVMYCASPRTSNSLCALADNVRVSAAIMVRNNLFIAFSFLSGYEMLSLISFVSSVSCFLCFLFLPFLVSSVSCFLFLEKESSPFDVAKLACLSE